MATPVKSKYFAAALFYVDLQVRPNAGMLEESAVQVDEVRRKVLTKDAAPRSTLIDRCQCNHVNR